jgi:antirestriction protein ArdC
VLKRRHEGLPRCSTVEQIESLPEIHYPRIEPKGTAPERIAHAEVFFAKAGADIRTCGNRASCAVDADYIAMPPIESFRDAESFYATLAHESTHWTRHASRLEREFGRKSWGDEGYAREELVAELGAAFLCCDLGLTPEVPEDHASYIASWLEVLKNDNRVIFQIASHAQRTVAFLHALQELKEAAA